MRSAWVMAVAAAAAAVVLSGAGSARAVTSVNLDFSGSGSTLAATGFDGVYNLDASGFTVGGGTLQLKTLPGDTFGRYEGDEPGRSDPDDAKNVFYSNIDPLATTQVDAKIAYNNLVSGFAGGGIWMGVDTDHYVRLGVFRNGGDINVEVLRENQDLWPANTQAGSPPLPPGPGRDIVGTQTTIGAFPAPADLTVYLRLLRTGNNAQAFYSLDGSTFIEVDANPDVPGIQPADAISIDASNLGVPGALVSSVEGDGSYKVGIYAFNGPGDVSGQGTDSFDSFAAISVPEPAALAGLALLAPLFVKRRRA